MKRQYDHPAENSKGPSSNARRRASLIVRLGHWAPLGMLAWYLLIPSAAVDPTVVQNEPLSSWQIVRGFDHSDDCEDFKDDFVRGSAQKHTMNALEPNYRYYMYAECIASNDPRLFYGKR